jgi:hypothetical protein
MLEGTEHIAEQEIHELDSVVLGKLDHIGGRTHFLISSWSIVSLRVRALFWPFSSVGESRKKVLPEIPG